MLHSVFPLLGALPDHDWPAEASGSIGGHPGGQNPKLCGGNAQVRLSAFIFKGFGSGKQKSEFLFCQKIMESGHPVGDSSTDFCPVLVSIAFIISLYRYRYYLLYKFLSKKNSGSLPLKSSASSYRQIYFYCGNCLLYQLKNKPTWNHSYKHKAHCKTVIFENFSFEDRFGNNTNGKASKDMNTCTVQYLLFFLFAAGARWL